MKRFNCTLADKRGEFGECMEVHSAGRYVLFSDVEKLQRRMQELLDKNNRTGVAIERAISTGSVLADHPLKSRLELLANHHKREQALADGMVAMADRCKLLADLLLEVTRVVPAIGVAIDDLPVVDAFLERIESTLSGNQPDQSGIGQVLEPNVDTMAGKWPDKCPITRRDFFMEIDDVPTYGGPYDSYTIPEMLGTPEQPWHERELFVRRYDHDQDCWSDDEIIPLRIINDEVLMELEDAAEKSCAVPDGWRLVPVEPTSEMLDATNEHIWGRDTDQNDMLFAYRAMLASAPKPQGGVA